HISRYLLHISRYLLHISRYLLHISRYLLHISRCVLHVPSMMVAMGSVKRNAIPVFTHKIYIHIGRIPRCAYYGYVYCTCSPRPRITLFTTRIPLFTTHTTLFTTQGGRTLHEDGDGEREEERDARDHRVRVRRVHVLACTAGMSAYS
ncbi:hypothetical protein T484DRAFT_3627820, partial [Baffinella frigidus]